MSEAAQDLLRQAMAGYAQDPGRGDFLIQYACTQADDPLPFYRVVYKFYNRQRRFDLAGDFALRALQEAGRQGGLPADPEDWSLEALRMVGTDVASNALLALKASSFIAFRRGDPETGELYLALLSELDPEDGSGVSVVSALAASVS
jgi:hypothetical protein